MDHVTKSYPSNLIKEYIPLGTSYITSNSKLILTWKTTSTGKRDLVMISKVLINLWLKQNEGELLVWKQTWFIAYWMTYLIILQEW